jgi:hypothetical protein
MRRLALALSLLALAATAHARVAPNPPGRALLSPDGAILQPGLLRAAAASRAEAAAVLNVGLPAGAVQLDSTYYDLQDMGSLGTRIVAGADGRVHVTYQKDFCEIGGGCPPNLNLPQPYPQRSMAYTYRDALGAWQHAGKLHDPAVAALPCCGVHEEFGGFGTIAVTPSGRAAIAQHINEEGCDLRGQFYLEDTPGGSGWVDKLPPFASPDSYLFPQITANPGGSFTLLGEVPIGGSYDETTRIGTSYYASAGGAYSCFAFQGAAWVTIAPNPAVMPASLFRDGRPAFPSLAVSSNGRVGIAVGDYGGNVYLIESSNGSFAPGTFTIRNLTNYSDATIVKGDSTSTQYRAWVHCHLAYNDTTPNVVWSELQARKVGTTIEYFDWRSRIRHWNPLRGISTVKQVQAGEADRFDDVDNLLSGPLAGFNTLAVDWPQVGFSADGSETYVAWLRASDQEIDATADMGLPGIITGVAFTDIAASVTRGADPWSPAQNLTNTPNVDERFFSLAQRNEGGKAHLVFQASATNQAGCVVIGDRGTSPGNILRRIAYLEKTLNGSLVDVGGSFDAPPGATLRSWPNPARGRVHFRMEAAAAGAARAAVDIYGIDGRRFARVSLDRGEAEWDGRDERGRAAPAGVYLARLAGGGQRMGTKFLLVH